MREIKQPEVSDLCSDIPNSGKNYQPLWLIIDKLEKHENGPGGLGIDLRERPCKKTKVGSPTLNKKGQFCFWRQI